MIGSRRAPVALASISGTSGNDQLVGTSGDRDGTGTVAPVLFATLQMHPANLSAADLVVT